MHWRWTSLDACRLACIAIVIAAIVVTEVVSNSDDDGDEDFLTAVHRCEGVTPQCPWNSVPVTSTGCCPQQAGQTCSTAFQLICNRDFGLRCVNDNGTSHLTDETGICKGKYNLTAAEVGERQATLTWQHFAPPGYQFEYLLLLRKDTYHKDISQWQIIDCGMEDWHTLGRLTPATTYLIKMAVWDDVRTLSVGTTTETVVVVTKAVDHCEGTETRHKVGEWFIYDQEENCTCLPSGTFECIPLCPYGFPEMVEGCRAVLGEGCQYNITCSVEDEDSFQEADEICSYYPDGTELNLDCQVCTCQREKLICSYPEECENLKPSCRKLRKIKVPGKCCPQWKCDDICVHENRTYNGWELFTSKECGLCICQPDGKVRCVRKCPPVEMVQPSLQCPQPHIKRSGCCDTLHCFKTEADRVTFIRNLIAYYTTSVSLTVSFEATKSCELKGKPVYCNYRIQYANTSTPRETTVWHNRIVHPADVLKSDYIGTAHYTHPIDVLTQDTAIVVEDRALITLSGMRPQTEFYVVVTQEERIEFQEDMMSEEEKEESSVIIGDSSHSAKVVVKTRPLENVTSCFHSGQEVLHGEVVSEACNQVCICNLGQIVCHSTCHDEKIVVAASLSCPQPRLETLKGECCPMWQCNPTVSGCRYKNAVLRQGQVVSDGCQECICVNSSVQCVSLCPPATASPRPGCILTNHRGHCCPQWSCPVERTTPIAIQSTLLLRFKGLCVSPVRTFKKEVATQILDYVTKVMNCSNLLNGAFSACSNLSVDVDCNPKSFNHTVVRTKRSSDDELDSNFIQVLISVRKDFSSEKDSEIVLKAGNELQKILNTSFAISFQEDSTIYSLPGSHLRKPVYICNHGFFYKEGQCVLSQIDIIGSTSTQVELFPLDISSQSVTFQWSPLPQSILKSISNLQLQYRVYGTVMWMETKSLPTWRTSFTVSNLHSHTSYDASLVALTNRYVDFNHTDNGYDGSEDGLHKWTLGHTVFETTPVSDELLSSSIVLYSGSVSESSVVLIWTLSWTQEVWEQVKLISVHYWVSKSDLKRQEIKNQKLPFVNLEGLASSTEYTIQLAVLLNSGNSLYSNSLSITTFSSEKCGESFLVPILLACLGIAVVAMVIILVLLWRRSLKQNNGDNMLERKT